MSNFDETIEKLKGEIDGHVAVLKSNESWLQIEKIYKALGTIEELAGVPPTSLVQLLGVVDGTTSYVSVRPGEFIGMEALDAAKLYMEKKKEQASSLDEILEAIQKGGAQTASRNDLRTSLGRSNWDVVKAQGQEIYTLLKYAPHVKRGKGKKSGSAQQEDVAEAASQTTGEPEVKP
jgi:hypothetical protein